jgi:hypothetical protein
MYCLLNQIPNRCCRVKVLYFRLRILAVRQIKQLVLIEVLQDRRFVLQYGVLVLVIYQFLSAYH